MTHIEHIPVEIMLLIFSQLDNDSLFKASQVSKRWKTIIHDMAWKAISRVVKMNQLLRDNYKRFGWVEEDHFQNFCKCIFIQYRLYQCKNSNLENVTYNIPFSKHSCVFATRVIDSKIFYVTGDKPWNQVGTFSYALRVINLKNMYQSKVLYRNQINKKNISEDGFHVYFELVSYEKSLIMDEIFDEEGERKIRKGSLWNIDTLDFVATIPLDDQKNIALYPEVSHNIHMAKNLLVYADTDQVNENFDVQFYEIQFWRLNTSKPTSDDLSIITQKSGEVYKAKGFFKCYETRNLDDLTPSWLVLVNDRYCCGALLTNENKFVLWVYQVVNHSDGETKIKKLKNQKLKGKHFMNESGNIVLEQGQSDRIAMQTIRKIKIHSIKSGNLLMRFSLGENIGISGLGIVFDSFILGKFIFLKRQKCGSFQYVVVNVNDKEKKNQIECKIRFQVVKSEQCHKWMKSFYVDHTGITFFWTCINRKIFIHKVSF